VNLVVNLTWLISEQNTPSIDFICEKNLLISALTNISEPIRCYPLLAFDLKSICIPLSILQNNNVLTVKKKEVTSIFL